MKILFKYTSRSRPDLFMRGLDSIIRNLSDMNNYHVLCSLDYDDHSLYDYAVKITQRNYNNITVKLGYSKNKVDAINRDVNEFQGHWDILVNMSDDMVFVKPLFDIHLREDMEKYFTDTDGVLHYNDGKQGINCMTLSIMGRKYYERTNYIYHPEYQSLWCDVEAQDVARMLYKYQYMGDDKIIFNHLHPSFGLAEYDKQYEKTEAHAIRIHDMITYNNRQANGFK